MNYCKTYGSKPGEGPSEIRAWAVLENVNEAHPTWNVTLQKWTTDDTVYESSVASEDELRSTFEKEFSGYNVSAWSD